MNNKTPLASIIVPVYNVEKYVNECLDSIIKQTYTNIEIIVVNDGSLDSSLKICQDYALKDARISIINQKNSGLSAARNSGLSVSKGDYIIFVDSDDLLEKHAVEMFINEAQASNAEVVLGKVKRFTQNGDMRDYNHIDKRQEKDGIDVLKMLLKGTPINISVCGGGYRRNLFDDLRFPVGVICEDWYIMPDIYLNVKKVILIPHLCYLYRENASSIMGGINRKPNPQVIDVSRRVITFIQHNSPNLYLETLWSNLRRVWKYIGLVYHNHTETEAASFIDATRRLMGDYWADLTKSNQMTFQERIGVWSFVRFPLLFKILRYIKN